MQRHAYLILAHSNLEQLKKLILLLDDGRNDIFLHVDAKNKAFRKEDFSTLCRESTLHFIEPRISVNWGGVSIMRAETALLKAAAPGHYAYYHLLSGMDLPIKSQDEIHSFFDAHQGCEFLNFWQFKSSTQRRFHYWTMFPEGAGKFWQNLCNNIVKGLLIILGIQINKGIDFRFASQWFSITDDLAHYVLGKEDWLEKVFSHTSTPDENFLATLVWNSPFKDKLYDATQYLENKDVHTTATMRFIDWSRGESIRHPWTFRDNDYDLLMSVPHFWARKFDERVDPQIIERIYQNLKVPTGMTPSR